MDTWIFLALLAAFCWGVAQVFIKKGYSNISPLWNNIFANIFGFLVQASIVWYLARGKFNLPTVSIAIVLFLATALYMFYPYVLQKGEVALTGTLMSTYPLFTSLLCWIFLKEVISSIQFLGVLIIISSIVLIGLPDKKILARIKDRSWVFFGLGFAVISGTGDFLSKIVVNNIGAYSQVFFGSIIFLLYSFPNYALDKKGRFLPKFSLKKFWPTLVGNFLLPLGSLFYFLAFDYGPASLIAPTAAVYQIITVILAVIFLKEKVSFKQAVGIIGSIAGVVLISMNGQ